MMRTTPWGKIRPTMRHFHSFCSNYGILGCVVNPWSRRGKAKLCRGKAKLCRGKAKLCRGHPTPLNWSKLCTFWTKPKMFDQEIILSINNPSRQWTNCHEWHLTGTNMIYLINAETCRQWNSQECHRCRLVLRQRLRSWHEKKTSTNNSNGLSDATITRIMVTSDFQFYILDLLLFSASLVPNMAASTGEAQRLLDEAKARRERARQKALQGSKEMPQKLPQAPAAPGEWWHSWEIGTIGANVQKYPDLKL